MIKHGFVSSSGTCAAIGDPHMKTFDGKYYNLLLRQCEYVLAQLTEGENIFTIKLRKRHCANPMRYCKRDVSIEIEGEDVIRLDYDDVNKQPLAFFEPANGYRRAVTSGYHSKNVKVEFMGRHNIFVHASEAKFTLQWTGESAFLTVAKEWKDKTEGLCGFFNNDQSDDFKLPSGAVATGAEDFTKNWLSVGNQAPSCTEPWAGDCFDFYLRNI